MFAYKDHHYAPILKWKLGEVNACGSVRREMSRCILPIFVIPPSSEFDYDKLQTVTLVEHLRHFGSRLKASCGDRPALIDASPLDTPELQDKFGCHPLRALLERARQHHAWAYPVVSLSSSSAYIGAARAFLSRHDHLGFCVRLRVSEFDRPGWANDLEALLHALGQRVAKGVLLIDAGVLHRAGNDFVSLLIERINSVPSLAEWGAVFFASTSFPERRDTPIGQTGRFERTDKSLYVMIHDRRDELVRVPRYSDYALEYPSKFRKGGGTPKAHLRYSANNHYLVAEGATTKGNGFKAIQPVATHLTEQMEFQGREFSAGNGFVEDLANGSATGNPSKWRWAATDHHLTLIITEQSTMHGFDVDARETLAEVEQQSLIPGLLTSNIIS